MRKVFIVFMAISLLSVTNVIETNAELFGGVEFPNGFSSFADEVISYDCAYNNGAGGGTCPTESSMLDPERSLGAPGDGYVSLGLGGLLELKFTDNLLTNSGDSAIDLWIFEVGAPQGGETESTFVAIRPTVETLAVPGFSGTLGTNGFYKVGTAGGSVNGIDIDSFFPGFAPGILQFNAVQIIDRDYNPANGGSHGADIDAVGAISSEVILPKANAGSDQIICKQICDVIMLNGRKSSDPNDAIVLFEWNIKHRVNSAFDMIAEGETPVISDLESGIYDVVLTVTSELGFTDTDEMILTVQENCDPCLILKGDLDSDGDVDGDDLKIFSQNFGAILTTP